MPVKTAWTNRITSYSDEAPQDLVAHPQNPKSHPKAQQAALAGALTDLGWLMPVIQNDETGHLLDGHARIALAIQRGEASVPVAHVSLPEHLEAEALLTIDPIGGMAVLEQAQVDALLRSVETGDAALLALFAELGQVVPAFAPVGIEEQGRLDQKQPLQCPECGHVFAT